MPAEPQWRRHIQIHQRCRANAHLRLLDAVHINPEMLRRQPLHHVMPAVAGEADRLSNRAIGVSAVANLKPRVTLIYKDQIAERGVVAFVDDARSAGRLRCGPTARC